MTPKQIQEIQTFRKTTKDAAAANRALAVLLLVRGGDMSYALYTVDHARRLTYTYIQHGIAAFEDKRKNNRDRVLTKVERETVVRALQTKQPKDVLPGCSDEHWSTYHLGEYVLTLTGKRYKSRTSHYLLSREAKLTFHLPGKAYERAGLTQKAAWVKETVPILKRHWHESGTVIL